MHKNCLDKADELVVFQLYTVTLVVVQYIAVEGMMQQVVASVDIDCIDFWYHTGLGDNPDQEDRYNFNVKKNKKIRTI